MGLSEYLVEEICKINEKKISEEEFQQTLKNLQETGHSNSKAYKEIIEACKKNFRIITSYEGEMPFNEYVKRLKTGEFDK